MSLPIDIPGAVESMNRYGYAVLPNAFDKEMLSTIKSRLDGYYKTDQERFGKDYLLQVNEIETLRNVIEFDPIFIDLLENHKPFDDVMRALLHDYAILHNYNIITLFPDLKSKMLGHQWHRDVYYFGPGIRTAVNVIIPLQKMTKENGSTEVLPGSHLHKDLPSEELIKQHKVSSDLELGDVLICDASTFHSAGINNSGNPRSIIVLKYTLSFFTQQYDFCRSLPVETYSDWLKGRLGYNVRVAENIKEFRVLPDKRKYKWPLRY